MSIARRVLDLQTNVAHLIDYNQDKTNLPKDPDLLVYKLQLSLITENKAKLDILTLYITLICYSLNETFSSFK
jgi:hypothetical protein